MPATDSPLISRIASFQNYDEYRNLHWEGTFEEYLDIVKTRPEVTRNAYQRLYDMIVSYGEEEYIDNKKRLIRYPFFTDPIDGGIHAIFGLDIPLMRLVNVLHAAALGNGPENRSTLLHGPVGSSTSTIARVMTQALEHYSRSPEGAPCTSRSVTPKVTGPAAGDAAVPCSMNEEPLKLIRQE